MFGLSIIIASAIAGISVVQLMIAIYFRAMVAIRLKNPATRHAAGTDEPMASIIVSVRGCDPSLRRSLIRLLEQEYSNFEIHVVVDHKSDFAWNLVHEVKSEFDARHRLTIHEMVEPLETCGLKCSALVQALESVADNSKYLVLIDADVVPNKNWLREVTSPLTDPAIGVVTGNQWFEPSTPSSIGAMLRSLWNAGAIVPTAIFNNPWAGTFAMRMEDVVAADLPNIWRNSVVDDGPIRQAIKPLGLKIRFQPSLIMVNREDCTFGYVNQYVARMLTWSKLYEKTFINTVIHAVVSNGVLILAAILLLLSSFWLESNSVITVGSGLLIYVASSLLAYMFVRSGVAQAIQSRGESLGRMPIGSILKAAVLIPIAQLVYGVSCLRALFMQKVMWRQITYEVKSKSQVKMLRYRPLVVEPEQSQASSEVSKVSI